jgi:hypothetical protein
MLNQFKNLSCYEEFEIQSALTCISKNDVLKEIGHQINDYYFFVSEDGVFNWYDLKGNHVKDPGILKTLICDYVPLNITKCIIPNSVTNISDGTFYRCESLTKITIPDSVTHIGTRAFSHCYSLKEITIPDNVTSIGDRAFSFSGSLTSITISDSVTSIGYSSFFACNSLKEVIFKCKTLGEVKQMVYYPFGIKDESVICISH